MSPIIFPFSVARRRSGFGGFNSVEYIRNFHNKNYSLAQYLNNVRLSVVFYGLSIFFSEYYKVCYALYTMKCVIFDLRMRLAVESSKRTIPHFTA